MFTASGKVVSVCDVASGTNTNTHKGWAKQVFILETFNREDHGVVGVTDPYRHKIVIEVWGEDKIKEYSKFYSMDGELFNLPPVTVDFEINGRSVDGKWYSSNSLVSMRYYGQQENLKDITQRLVNQFSVKK